MRTRYDAALGGAALCAVDEAIIVTDVAEEVRNSAQTAPWAAGDGLRRYALRRERLAVTVSFEIHERDVPRYADALQRVQRWAHAGGMLRVSHRPGQRLRCVCEQSPTLASALRWTGRLQAVFAAYAVPYWEDETALQVTVTDRASVYVPGTAACAPCEAAIRNTGEGTITRATLTAGDTHLTFEGIALGPGQTLLLTYPDGRTLAAHIGGSSVLAGCTTDSDDDLCVPCGARVRLACEATGSAARTTFTLRGRYL